MSIAVMQSSSAAASFHLEKCSWVAPAECCRREADPPPPLAAAEEALPAQSDIWSAILSQKKAAAAEQPAAAPYVHPLVRRSSSLLSQESLELCTESLGSETGSDDFSFMDDLFRGEEIEEVAAVGETEVTPAASELGGMRRHRRHGTQLMMSVNSDGRRSPPRSFPPPLPSISQRNVPCLHMRPRRVDGRLVVEAVAVPSKNYLHAHRVDGRLLLSFTGTTSGDETDAFERAIEITKPQVEGKIEELEAAETTQIDEAEEEELEVDDEEEEEVEVVDRGTVIEVKVSTQPPQQQSGAMKVHRSSFVINKFVGGTPLGITAAEPEPPTPEHDNDDENSSNLNEYNHTVPPSSAAAAAVAAPRRTLPTTTTAAAAVVAASTLSATASTATGYSHHPPLDNKLLFTSKRRNRDELLHNMRRCSQLRRRPLFIWEPCCVATSS